MQGFQIVPLLLFMISTALFYKEKLEIVTPALGTVNVHVQGTRSSNEVVVLTVHDLGTSHEVYVDLLATPAMETLARRCVWVHIDLPGQGDGDGDLPSDFSFPSIQAIGNDIIHILDHLSLKEVVLFGEGAGANILARFAMEHDERVLGAVLFSITGSTHRLDKIKSWLISNPSTINSQVESYLVGHRFGEVDMKNDKEAKTMVSNFVDSVKQNRNPKNLAKFINAYANRESIANKMSKVKCPILFMTGSMSSTSHSTHNLYENLMKSLRNEPERRTKIELVEVERARNVFSDAPEKVAQSFQYFIQGLGLAGWIPVFQGDMKLNRRMSMEDYDRPRGRNSLSSCSSPPLGTSPTGDDPLGEVPESHERI